MQNIWCEYSKETSQWEGFSEHPKHKYEMMGNIIITILHSKEILVRPYVWHSNWISRTKVKIFETFLCNWYYYAHILSYLFKNLQNRLLSTTKAWLPEYLFQKGKPVLLTTIHLMFPCRCHILPSAENLCKQFGPRSGPTECRSWSGSKPFDTLIVFLKECIKKVDFEKRQQTTTKAWKIT